jgi:N-methylhydantoinase A
VVVRFNAAPHRKWRAPFGLSSGSKTVWSLQGVLANTQFQSYYLTEMSMIIGLDVGGTHTDVVLLGAAGLVNSVKIPTDPTDLFNTVLCALRKITAGLDPQHIQRLVLSTTLTTNAIAQRKIPEVGMLVLSGPGIDPEFFRTNQHYYVISGAIDHRGREVQPIDPDEVKKNSRIFESEDIRHVGVVGKF